MKKNPLPIKVVVSYWTEQQRSNIPLCTRTSRLPVGEDQEPEPEYSHGAVLGVAGEQHGDHVHDGDPVPDSARVALVDGLAEQGVDSLTVVERAQEGGDGPHPVLHHLAVLHHLRLGQDVSPDPEVGEYPLEVEPRLTTSFTYSVITRICSRISNDRFIRGNILMSVLDNCSRATAAVSQVVNRQNLIP